MIINHLGDAILSNYFSTGWQGEHHFTVWTHYLLETVRHRDNSFGRRIYRATLREKFDKQPV